MVELSARKKEVLSAAMELRKGCVTSSLFALTGVIAVVYSLAQVGDGLVGVFKGVGFKEAYQASIEKTDNEIGG